jgi:oligo-alginate lyase
MLKLSLFIVIITGCVSATAQQRPVAFITGPEAAYVKKNITAYPLLLQSYNIIKKQVDEYLGKEVDVPVPKDPAGGYTHDKHKMNYTLMFNSGLLYAINGEKKYAALVKNMLLKYAALNPTLQKHPQATSASPGHLFWQALNDANWLVYAGLAYDLIYNYLGSDERKRIENGAFKPEVDYLTKDLRTWFDRLHNHSVWACAGVGIVGIASNNKEYIDLALYGSNKDGKTGFIAQMNSLFSPDGYYTEGPYYVRYAILPYMLFANALHNTKPELKIFEHRNSILQKALTTCLQQTNTDGVFFPLNDALKDKDFTTNELVTAINIARKVYGNDMGLLSVAKKQNRVLLNKGGVEIAASIAQNKNIPVYYPYSTIESTDGINGERGGISILRSGKEDKLTSLIFKYASQGMGHGHFDRLNINLFDKGNEILTDYGSARFIGIEQKYGGRYLPENESYAAQTIAHNTLVADEASHFNGNSDEGEKYNPQKLFSNLTNPRVQVVAAGETNAYKDIAMQRTVFLLELPDGKKMVADIFKAASSSPHQYDFPFQYNGQLISTSFKYTAHTKTQETLSKKNGYQFIWKEATGTVADTTICFTFLNGRTYYSLSSLIQDSATVFFTRSGAGDPQFNLRRQPSYIIRKNAASHVFVNMVEIHGQYDPVNEFSTGAYASVKKIQLVLNNNDYTVAAITLEGGNELLLFLCNKNFGNTQPHAVVAGNKQHNWTGPCSVLYNNKPL